MTILVIGDIHNQWWPAERLLREVPHDRAVLLGDYFDDFGDDPGIARDTALWLRYSLQQPTRIHLLGNHDLPYATDGRFLCPGFTYEKFAAVRQVLTPEHWGTIQFHAWANGWLLTHAGLHRSFCSVPGTEPSRDDFREFLANQDLGARIGMMNAERHWYFWLGWCRGGDHPLGGILWLDFRNEFSPIHGVNQIVGHTPGWTAPPYYGECHFGDSLNYCIDTGLRFYALLDESGGCRIEEVPSYTRWHPTPENRARALAELGIA